MPTWTFSTSLGPRERRHVYVEFTPLFMTYLLPYRRGGLIVRPKSGVAWEHNIMASGDETCGADRRGALSRDDLVAGNFVTVSANKHFADRSLADAIWEIVALNEGHVLLEFRGPGQPLDPSRTRCLVPLNEHDFYDAAHLASVCESAASEPKATVVRIRD
jgi:hypothetical protein